MCGVSLKWQYQESSHGVSLKWAFLDGGGFPAIRGLFHRVHRSTGFVVSQGSLFHRDHRSTGFVVSLGRGEQDSLFPLCVVWQGSLIPRAGGE